MRQKVLLFWTLLFGYELFGSTDGQEGDPPLMIAFCDLADCPTFESRTVRIRGFLYPAENGAFILAAEPNLKTCCLNVKKRRICRIQFRGEIPSVRSYAPVTIQGMFRHLPTSEFFYTIEDATLIEDTVQKKQYHYLIWIMGSVFCMVFVMFLRFRFPKTDLPTIPK